METDDYDPWADPEQTPQEIYDRGLVSDQYFREYYMQAPQPASPPRVSMGQGGAGGFYSGGGGGGGGYVSIRYDSNTNRLIPDLTQLTPKQTPEERQEMNWTNPEAADIAREILNDEKKEGLRETVTTAVAHFRELLAGAHCGSVFSFMKENEQGKHYFYAAIKNGDVWYTTAQNPRTIEGDDAFITWLIGLGAHESAHSELTVGSLLELGPIDATATE